VTDRTTVLARWPDDESAAGRTTVLARWRDDESAAGRTTVLARWRDDESAAGLTMVLARWHDDKSAAWQTMVLTRWRDDELAAGRKARGILPSVQPLTQQSTVSGAVGAGQPAADRKNVDGGPAGARMSWQRGAAVLACWRDDKLAGRTDDGACPLARGRVDRRADDGTCLLVCRGCIQ